jgi:ABC-type branched-subunit amino acid transport system ATPase component
MADDVILSCRAIVKTYGATEALKGVDFSVRRGKVTVLFGENGAGKSTLMKIISGVEQPTSGVMTLNGAVILGMDHEVGSVEVGKRGDLVVIQGDPVSRPEDIRKVVTVFKDGVGFDAARLEASIQGQVGIR